MYLWINNLISLSSWGLSVVSSIRGRSQNPHLKPSIFETRPPPVVTNCPSSTQNCQFSNVFQSAILPPQNGLAAPNGLKEEGRGQVFEVLDIFDLRCPLLVPVPWNARRNRHLKNTVLQFQAAPSIRSLLCSQLYLKCVQNNFPTYTLSDAFVLKILPPVAPKEFL